MKKISIFVIALLLIAIGVTHLKSLEKSMYNLAYYSPCDTPILYKLGIVDPRFGLSKNEFMADIKTATNIWSDSVNKKLFAYSPQGSLTVNLIYDNRQYLDSRINQAEKNLSPSKSSLSSQVQQYNELEQEFETQVNNLNSQIAYYNSKGGAPPDVYNQIMQQENDLKNQQQKLNQMAQELNQSEQSYNYQVAQLNSEVNNFNIALNQKPEEGLYNSYKREIDIYFDNNYDELIHTLAHEFGHSLGLGHNSNRKSIMYPYTTSFLIPTVNDLNDLKNVCKYKSVIFLFEDKLLILAANLSSKMKLQ